MFATLKKMFGTEDRVVQDVPAVEEKLPEKDISEPVISFVKTFKKNPKRFKARLKDHSFESADYPDYKTLEQYELTDKWTGEKFSVIKWDRISFNMSSGSTTRSRIWSNTSSTNWMTYKEVNHVSEIVFEAYEARIENVRVNRKEALKERQRNRLKSIYCTEGEE